MYFPGVREDSVGVVMIEENFWRLFLACCKLVETSRIAERLMVRYKNMIREPKSTVQLVPKFIGINRYEESMEATPESSFANMKAKGMDKYSTMMVRDFLNDTYAKLFCEGKTGTWRDLIMCTSRGRGLEEAMLTLPENPLLNTHFVVRLGAQIRELPDEAHYIILKSPVSSHRIIVYFIAGLCDITQKISDHYY